MERVFARLERQERNTLALLLRKLGREAEALHAERVSAESKKGR
jgi:hypothetical protein